MDILHPFFRYLELILQIKDYFSKVIIGSFANLFVIPMCGVCVCLCLCVCGSFCHTISLTGLLCSVVMSPWPGIVNLVPLRPQSPSPPLPSLRYMKTKFFNVTCHFFWTKGWSLLVTKIPWNHIHTRCLVLSPHKETRLQLLLAMARNLSIGTRRKQKLKT